MSDPYKLAFMRHINFMLRRGPAVILFQKDKRQFVLNLFTELSIPPTTEGVVLCCYDEPLMSAPNFRFDSFENVINTCGQIGGVIIVSANFAEHMLLQRRCDRIKRCHVPVVSAFGYSVLPGPQNVAWADTGVTYPGIFSLAAAYTANLRAPNPSYVEFGAMEGRTVTYAWHFLSRALADCTYFVFDSFEGVIGSMSSEVDYFHEGSFFANEETFFHNMEVSGVDLKRVTVIKGDIVERCAETSPITAEIDFGNVVLANIDVDIYAPAKAALNFLGRIMADGAIILFDDYDEMGADNNRGERLALKEWLEENPLFSVERYRDYAIFGRSFIFHRG
jgi:hypothetical protein